MVCPVGSYSDNTDPVACSLCAAGKTSSAGASSCQDIPSVPEGSSTATVTVSVEVTLGGVTAASFTDAGRASFKAAVSRTYVVTIAQISITSVVDVSVLLTGSSGCVVSYIIKRVPEESANSMQTSMTAADQSVFVENLNTAGLTQVSSAQPAKVTVTEKPAADDGNGTNSSKAAGAEVVMDNETVAAISVSVAVFIMCCCGFWYVRYQTALSQREVLSKRRSSESFPGLFEGDEDMQANPLGADKAGTPLGAETTTRVSNGGTMEMMPVGPAVTHVAKQPPPPAGPPPNRKNIDRPQVVDF